jgi:iron complex outermembrane receptor protein
VVSQTVLNSLASRGIVPQAGSEGLSYEAINLFSNGANTHTKGIEATANYASDFGSAGKVDWSIGFNYNTTKATYTAILPASVQNSAFNQIQLLTVNSISALTTATPKVKTILGALYTVGPFSFNLRETIYGSTSEYLSRTGATYTGLFIGTAAITDLNVSYKITPAIRFDVGANNLFDKKAPTIPTVGGQPLTGNIYNAPVSFTPWGINGGYYYAKATFTF